MSISKPSPQSTVLTMFTQRGVNPQVQSTNIVIIAIVNYHLLFSQHNKAILAQYISVLN